MDAIAVFRLRDDSILIFIAHKRLVALTTMAAVEVSAVDWVDDVGTVDGEQAAIGVD